MQTSRRRRTSFRICDARERARSQRKAEPLTRTGFASALLAISSCVIATAAAAIDLSSANYRILGASVSGGGHGTMTSLSPSPQIGALGASLGQSEALGFAGSPVNLRTIAPGFWPIVAGDFPTLDVDADGVAAYRDNCPFAFNPAQTDTGGVLTSSPDGIGDTCQCGDVDNDGIVDEFDVEAYRDSLADPIALALSAEGVEKCSVIDSPGPCEMLDVTIIARALEPTPLLPGIAGVCYAASPP